MAELEEPKNALHPSRYDTLVPPGGVMSAETLRSSRNAVHVRARFRRRQQAQRGRLPRAMAPHRRRGRARSPIDLPAILARGPRRRYSPRTTPHR